MYYRFTIPEIVDCLQAHGYQVKPVGDYKLSEHTSNTLYWFKSNINAGSDSKRELYFIVNSIHIVNILYAEFGRIPVDVIWEGTVEVTYNLVEWE